MAYSKYTYLRLKTDLGIRIHYQTLFSHIEAHPPSEWLLQTLEIGRKTAFFSEKSRSETMVFPILAEIQQSSLESIVIYSGAELNIDETKDLNGECDYVLGKGEQLLALDAPLMCVIEAKDNDIEKAIPQCIAQMEAARQFNLLNQSLIYPIFGCATIGSEWLFIRLEYPNVYIDINRFHIANLRDLLGVLAQIMRT